MKQTLLLTSMCLTLLGCGSKSEAPTPPTPKVNQEQPAPQGQRKAFFAEHEIFHVHKLKDYQLTGPVSKMKTRENGKDKAREEMTFEHGYLTSLLSYDIEGKITKEDYTYQIHPKTQQRVLVKMERSGESTFLLEQRHDEQGNVIYIKEKDEDGLTLEKEIIYNDRENMSYQRIKANGNTSDLLPFAKRDPLGLPVEVYTYNSSNFKLNNKREYTYEGGRISTLIISRYNDEGKVKGVTRFAWGYDEKGLPSTHRSQISGLSSLQHSYSNYVLDEQNNWVSRIETTRRPGRRVNKSKEIREIVYVK
ncbi:MAG: hypothetical protein Q4A64_04620 [Porphyromonadaceae bacterium]|nr:hypothetical protein [Porphyromonadaceae bacterium]